MPTFTPETPRASYKFADIALTVPEPFAEGHVLTPNEAKFLNRSVAGTVGNQFGGSIRSHLKALDDANLAKFKKGEWIGEVVGEGKKQAPKPATVADLGASNEDHQAAFDEKYGAYELGVSNRGGTGTGSTSDPIAKIAAQIAGNKVKELAKAKGINIRVLMSTKTDTGTKFNDLVNAYIERTPDVMELAKALYEAAKSIGAEASEDDLFAGVEAEADAA